MSDSQKTPANQATDKRPPFSPQWIALLLCFFVLAAGIFMNFRQNPPAGNTTVIEQESIQPDTGKPVQENNNTATADLQAAIPSIWPISGPVTSNFGWRNSPWDGGGELHQGIDIANNLGIPVVAAADGEITISGWIDGYGNLVEINHGNGMVTRYGHNSQLAVGTGQHVKKGQVISFVGSTGRSTGPHLHYEIRVNGTAVNPFKYLVYY